jgi:hypothetical protein
LAGLDCLSLGYQDFHDFPRHRGTNLRLRRGTLFRSGGTWVVRRKVKGISSYTNLDLTLVTALPTPRSRWIHLNLEGAPGRQNRPDAGRRWKDGRLRPIAERDPDFRVHARIRTIGAPE